MRNQVVCDECGKEITHQHLLSKYQPRYTVEERYSRWGQSTTDFCSIKCMRAHFKHREGK